MELDFDKIFKIPTRALNISRAHPYIPRDRKWMLQFFIVHGLFTLAFLNILYNIINHDLKSNNFSQICKNGVLLVVYVVITFQYLVLLWHQDALVGLINNIKRDYEQSKDLNSVERDVMYKHVNQGVWVCKQWLVISSMGTGVFFVKSLSIMFYYYCINEFRLVPPHDLVYPTIIEENKDNIYVFMLTYALMMHYGCYATLMYTAYVPLGPIFMLHACGQLDLVKNRIDDLFSECDDEVIRKKLKVIIVQMQYIYIFVDRIKQIFRVAYELTLKATTLMLPITCYEVLEALNNGEVSLEFLTFIIGGTLISSSPCYYSDLLMEKGENVRLALYTCGWELHYDRRTRTTLQLMLQNALRPVAIQTIFRVLCLEALTDNNFQGPYYEVLMPSLFHCENGMVLAALSSYVALSHWKNGGINQEDIYDDSAYLFQQSYAIFNLMNAMWS